MMHLCVEYEKVPVQLRREWEELYLSWWTTISYSSLHYQNHWTLGQSTSQKGCRGLWYFPSFKNNKETNARRYFHFSFDAKTTTKIIKLLKFLCFRTEITSCETKDSFHFPSCFMIWGTHFSDNHKLSWKCLKGKLKTSFQGLLGSQTETQLHVRVIN